jgi:hypothetical protein
MSPIVIHSGENRGVGITTSCTLMIGVQRPRGDTADAHESPLLAVLRIYRPVVNTGAGLSELTGAAHQMTRAPRRMVPNIRRYSARQAERHAHRVRHRVHGDDPRSPPPRRGALILAPTCNSGGVTAAAEMQRDTLRWYLFRTSSRPHRRRFWLSVGPPARSAPGTPDVRCRR